MSKPYRDLMFITPQEDTSMIISLVQSFLSGGGRWVQLRLKDICEDQLYETAMQLAQLCKQFGAVFIVNDNPVIAKKVKADGVHLGKNDMNPLKARDIVGDNMIVGGTANSVDDMVKLAREKVDYIGLGPCHFTTTKKNLSEIITPRGYKNLIEQFRVAGYTLPVTAIGGITLNDISSLLKSGINGVALCTAISKSCDPASATGEIISLIEKSKSR
ncbi:thiamine phosphate synthase [Marinilabiliaceae bacterium ANBcel2]|nr:thiamine phosphate synthase [Marinilabiliaceae bacterium ANBcel2]